MNKQFLVFLFSLLACLLQGDPILAATDRPNILLILVDDLSWSDLGCYGQTWHETPHLDALADEGMRFTNGYAPAPICSASRASIFSGKTPARLQLEFVTKNSPGRQTLQAGQTLQTPHYTLNLPLSEQTLAERLGNAGYHTAFFGKWHLNAHHHRYLGWSPTHGPKQQGFQTAVEDFGSHPYRYSGNAEKPEAIKEIDKFPRDTMTQRAAGFLQQRHTKPWFLMVSHFYVHTPVSTPCRWLLDKYERRIPADVPNRNRRIRYAAFVETLDHYVGELLAELDKSGQRDETCVIFMSDNGGHPGYAANGPLRGSKWNLYEGGIRVPFIARWPGRIPVGSTNETPVIGYDLMPTFAALAGASLNPTEHNLDGQNLTKVLQNVDEKLDRTLVWHFPYYHPEKKFAEAAAEIGINDFTTSQTRPQSAIRRNNFKLIYDYERESAQLFDLENDLGEQHDLSEKLPAIAEDLQGQLTAYLDDVDARLPKPAKSIQASQNQTASDPQTRRPNILFIYTDDQAPWGFGASGYSQAHTPNLDRLASEGARLTNSFVTTPVCSPARASLMTSRYASEYGILDFIPHPKHKLYDPDKPIGLDPRSVTFAEVLQDHGYRTGLIGKWHLGDWVASGHRNYHPTNHGFEYFMGLTGGGSTPDNPLLEEEGKLRRHIGLTTDILTDKAITFLKGNAAKPFLLCLHYRAPHGRWLPVADEDWAPYADMDPVLPHPDYPDLDVGLLKRKTREYLASISGVDRNVGRLLQSLAELKLDANTVVIFTSDHGYNMGHNGIHHKGNGVWATKTLPEPTPNITSKYRPNLYDNSLKVPALVRWPNVVKPGTVIDDSTTSLDWYPTLVEIARAKLPQQHVVRGRSLLPLLRGETPADWDQNVYAEYSMINYCRAFMRTYRTPQWKLVRDFLNPQRDELYHLAVDPQERVNLIHENRPEIRAVVQRLDREIRRNLTAIGDPLLKELSNEPAEAPR